MGYRRLILVSAFALMLFQIALLRELRYQVSAYYTLAPFLFSAVVVFIGLGSLLSRLVRRTDLIAKATIGVLPSLMLAAYGATILIARMTVDRTQEMAYAFQATDVDPRLEHLDAITLPFLYVALGGYGIVFITQGLLFAALFREGRKSGHLEGFYALDLLASGLGALAGGVIAFHLSPLQTAVAAAAGLLAAAVLFRRTLGLGPKSLGASALLTVILAGGLLGPDLAHAEEAPEIRGMKALYSTWSPYRRIDVLEDKDVLAVLTDSLLFHVYRKGESDAWNPISIGLGQLQPDRRGEVLVIGAGTGSDLRILRRMYGDAVHVTAVELDPGFIETTRAVPWLRDSMEGADVVVQEGRNFLETTDRDFDAIIFAYIDPQSAISRIGVPDANFLYTVEGLKAAWAKVRPGGLLMVTRVFLVNQQEDFLRRLFATLDAAGLGDASKVYRLRRSLRYGYYGEISVLQVYAWKDQPPHEVNNVELTPLSPVFGGRPTTDAFPFSLETGVWFGILVDYVKEKPAFLWGAALSLLLLAVRLLTSRAHSVFFFLGLGSFLVESVVIFQSFLLLGSPALSAALAVGFLLLWNAVGSWGAARFARWKHFGWLCLAAILLHGFTAPLLSHLLLSHPPVWRVVGLGLHLALPGIPIGALFPQALMKYRERPVAGLFAIDLVGCALAPVVFWMAMSVWGLPFAVVLGALAYLMAIL